jgi:hypothetical protein
MRNAGERPSPGTGAPIASIAPPMNTDCEPVTRYAPPRATSSMPSVTMNEGIPHPTVTRPFAAPATSPAPSASGTAAINGQPHPVSALPSSALLSASTDPTDRSIPPTTSTNVIPIAITTSAGIWFASVTSVTRVRKCSLSAPKSTSSSASTASSPRRSFMRRHLRARRGR